MGGFKSSSKQFFESEGRVLKRTERTMGHVILNRSSMIAPVVSGGLVESGRIEDNPQGGISVIFGNAAAPHARRRHFENKKNPQTLRYLEKGGNSVAKENPKKYVDMNR